MAVPFPSRGKNGSTTSPESASLGWAKLYVREYDRIVGDHPSVSGGAPLGLDWNWTESGEQDIDEYERTRGYRRKGDEMAIPRMLREIILLEEWGCAQHDLSEAIRATLKIKQQRRTTANNAESAVVRAMEEKMEAIVHGVKKNSYCGKQRDALAVIDFMDVDSSEHIRGR